MKVKIDEKLLDVRGKEIVKPGDIEPFMTLRGVCIGSVLHPTTEDDEKIKYQRYEIYKKLRDAEIQVELTIEELATIKKCIGQLQPPLIMGQAFEMLEGK